LSIDVHAFPDYLKGRLATAIRDIEFSTRTHNVLDREQIVYVGDLVSSSEGELSALWGFGKKCLREVKAYLGPELKLGMQVSGWSHQTARDFQKFTKAAGWSESKAEGGSARTSKAAPIDILRDVQSLPEPV
jgi:hypothetical protein